MKYAGHSLQVVAAKGTVIIMKIYDISQEVFHCRVYPGDPMPEKKVLHSMEKGELYNLTAFSMCAHNGTHIDAPRHFIKNGNEDHVYGFEAVLERIIANLMWRSTAGS